MPRACAFFLLGLCLPFAPLPAETLDAPHESRELKVAYADDPHPEQFLDLHWSAEPSPLVLFVHGGGLGEAGERRDSEMYAGVCPALVERGVSCATIDYRLHPEFSWPAMPRDVASALKLVRERVQDRGGDPGLVFLFGHSSGCHLVATIGLNPRYLSAVGLAPENVAGVVAMGCTLDRHDTAARDVTSERVSVVLQRDDDAVRAQRGAAHARRG